MPLRAYINALTLSLPEENLTKTRRHPNHADLPDEICVTAQVTAVNECILMERIFSVLTKTHFLSNFTKYRGTKYGPTTLSHGERECKLRGRTITTSRARPPQNPFISTLLSGSSQKRICRGYPSIKFIMCSSKPPLHL